VKKQATKKTEPKKEAPPVEPRAGWILAVELTDERGERAKSPVKYPAGAEAPRDLSREALDGLKACGAVYFGDLDTLQPLPDPEAAATRPDAPAPVFQLNPLQSPGDES
jgi:hypothetical protein